MNKRMKYDEIKNIYSLVEYFEEISKFYGSEVAIKQSGLKKTVTYWELYESALSIAGEFSRRGYKEKNIVLIGDFSYQWIATFFGILISGNVVVPINPALEEQKINDLTNFVDAVSLIQLNSAHRKESISLQVNVEKISDSDIIEIAEKKSYAFEVQHIESNQLAMLLFTSGTTGKEKCVMLTHKNIICDTKGAILATQLGTDIYGSNLVPVLPVFHMFQITAGFLAPMFYGVTYCINTSNPILLESFKEYKPVSLFVVPLILESIYKRIMSNKRKCFELKVLHCIHYLLSFFHIDVRDVLFRKIYRIFGENIHYIICGGAACKKEVIKFFNDIGIVTMVGYGTTECSPIISCNMNGFVKYDSVGFCLPNEFVEVKIVEQEIWVKGDIVMSGYYKNSKATSEAFNKGWYMTGDMGVIDTEGYLYITGRKKNVIIMSDGNNISPEEIESRLKGKNQIEEVIVYCRREGSHELLSAMIYPNYEEYIGCSKEIIIKDIKQIVKNYNLTCLKYMYISHVEIMDEPFKKNMLGKEKRYEYI